jgi:vacuolar-type H+-ATPase subunit H
VDILYLVDRLENLIASSRKMPLVNQIIMKESDILNIVDQLRTTIPDEIKQARRVIQDKERILAQAQAEANALLARAREESEQAVNRQGLLRVAETRAQELVQRAEGEAEQLKNEADSYVIETLRALRDHLTSIETDIGRSILSVEKGLASLEDEPLTMHDDVDSPLEGAEGPRQASPAHPRRSSLAADTMGAPMYVQEEEVWDVDTGVAEAVHQDLSSRPVRGYDRA